MQSVNLTHRDEQVAELRRAFADAREASGRIVLITGAVGSGKTVLLTQFADETVADGALRLDASAARGEDRIPFGILRRLMAHAPLSPSARAEADRLLRPQSAPLEPAAVTEAIPQLAVALLRSAGDRLLVIAVDDVHHSDQQSLQFLLHMARRIRHERVLMVFTDTARRWDSTARYRSELSQQPHFRRIRLKLLSRTGTQELMAGQLPPAAVARLSGELHQVTGGNPLLLRALAADYRATAEAEGTPLKVIRAETYDEALLDCLHRCGTESLAVARAIAVLGERCTPALLCRLLNLSTQAVDMALYTLNLCGVVHGNCIRDPEALKTIYHATPAAVLADLHRDSAALLHAEGAPATEVARHLLRLLNGHELWAAPVLREAAEHALAGGDTAFARRCLEEALAASADDRVRAAVRQRLTGVLWRTLPTATETHLPQLLIDMTEGLLSPVEASATLSQLAWTGQVEQAAEVTEQLSEAQPWGPDVDGCLTGVRSWLAMLSPRLRERLAGDGTAPSGEEARTDDPYFHAAAAVTESLSSASTDKALYVLQRYQLGDTTVQSLVFALWALIYAERLDLADDWSRRLLAECSGTNASSWQALLQSVRAEVELRRSRLSGAEHLANVAMRGMSTRSWGLGVAFPLSVRVEALTRMGCFDEALDLLSRPVPEALLETLPGLHYLRARGHFYLATNRHHAALGDFLACGELVERWGADTPALVPWRTDAAEAWLALGQHKRAARAAAEQLARIPAQERRLRGITLRVLGAATRDTTARTAMLQEAAELLEGGEDQLQLALTLGELGDVHHAAGDFGGARMLARRAWHLAKSCGAEPVCRRLAPLRPEEESPVEPGPENELSQANDALLSEAENRVAVLAAQGLTNREISAKLYITVSTVEQHLTRIYRKLGVKRRRDLPTALAELAQAAC
ncbi:MULTISPECIES: AAA family ATPase [unclassified Streptomyces]|uniref:AAA family ATPase n=1 Tax=unclassified Streptomyces TaxID=2593676 RepID=UPI000F6D000B|nr:MULTISPECIES: LuxR family transcriptional regulator [unclassified Streptomyces]AZM62223.1 transcriptional regulator [Streptomyces sp. WAC 01438]RSN00142.1 transcriptional regulator [Streptomyces sp. WAC 01420]